MTGMVIRRNNSDALGRCEASLEGRSMKQRTQQDQLYVTAIAPNLALIHQALAFDAEVRRTFFANGKVGAVIAVSSEHHLSLAGRLAPYGDGRAFLDPQVAWREVAANLEWARP